MKKSIYIERGPLGGEGLGVLLYLPRKDFLGKKGKRTPGDHRSSRWVEDKAESGGGGAGGTLFHLLFVIDEKEQKALRLLQNSWSVNSMLHRK